MALIANGNDPWQTGETPNDKLLKIARSVAQERMQERVTIIPNIIEKDTNKRSQRFDPIKFLF